LAQAAKQTKLPRNGSDQINNNATVKERKPSTSPREKQRADQSYGAAIEAVGVEEGIDLSEIPPLHIIVPFYKNAHLVPRFHQALEACGPELERLNARITYINDSPADIEVKKELDKVKIKTKLNKIAIITNDKNIGFINSVNNGLLESIERGEDVVLLNSDTIVFPNAISELQAACYTDPMIGFGSPRSNNATICTSPYGANETDTDPAEAARAHFTIADRMERVVYTPTAVGFCLYIKWLILDEFGIFDPIYGKGYNEENDLIMRANRRGFRSIMANNSFVWHEGEQSFSKTESGKEERDQKNEKVLLSRYPEYRSIVRNYFNSEEFLSEKVLSGIISDNRGKLLVGFDLSNVGVYHNGTFEAAKRILFAATKVWPERIRIIVFCSREAWEFHSLGNTDRLERRDPGDQSRPVAAIIRIGQPFDWPSVERLTLISPVIAVFMLDTIAYDCGYLSINFDSNIWKFALRWFDIIITNSKFTADQFKRRFMVGDETDIFPSLHSLDLSEYMSEKSEIDELDGRSPSNELIVIGNKFHHKGLDTIVPLLEKLPDEIGVTVLGGSGHSGGRIKYREVGQIPDREMETLYTSAGAILFPSYYEGFGFPIMQGISRGIPVIARDLPPYREMAARLSAGSGNIYFYKSTNDLFKLLEGGLPRWTGPKAAGEHGGWERSANEVLQAVSHHIENVTQQKISDRLRWLRAALGATHNRPFSPPTSVSDVQQTQMLNVTPAAQASVFVGKLAENVAYRMLARKSFYSAARILWRGLKIVSR
jgi:GT2 family glycosyltransferase